MKRFKFHGIPWNFCSRSGDSMEFHGIPWNLVLASSAMEFHGTSLLTWKNSMEFHGTSGEFHGIPWNCEILILINFIIGEVYFTVCCIISCYYISDNPLVVEMLRYFNSKATFGAPHFAQMAIFHSKWRPVIYINTELLDGNKGHQEETHHPTYRFRRLFLDLLLMGWRRCVSAMGAIKLPSSCASPKVMCQSIHIV